MYTASLSYNNPPTSDIGAYSSFDRSSNFLCFFSVDGSGHGSGSSASSLTSQSPTPATCTSCPLFRLHPCSHPYTATSRSIPGFAWTKPGGVMSSNRSPTTYGCDVRHVSGRNFDVEMNRARFSVSRLLYLPCCIPDR
eukprot:30670-Pelagococcus_subviridis.AAC.6